MNQIELKSLAKINLGLDVLGRRENGYHDVRMVMQSIYLHDEVKLTKKEEPVQPIPQAQPAPAPKPVVQTPAAPADDTQLIAVITAAVAAAMEQDGVVVPADGLVIRSIKKRSY